MDDGRGTRAMGCARICVPGCVLQYFLRATLQRTSWRNNKALQKGFSSARLVYTEGFSNLQQLLSVIWSYVLCVYVSKTHTHIYIQFSLLVMNCWAHFLHSLVFMPFELRHVSFCHFKKAPRICFISLFQNVWDIEGCLFCPGRSANQGEIAPK